MKGPPSLGWQVGQRHRDLRLSVQAVKRAVGQVLEETPGTLVGQGQEAGRRGVEPVRVPLAAIALPTTATSARAEWAGLPTGARTVKW